ncbi:protein yippee-like isoform X1 [Salvia splendens]|uniref:protein yippee-like isoform X1 n=1 Tax=Salvia splendens TaxID=180675 RepID=UPI001C272336|nr:protein yippee-like isoform X1 [Salvia splendens]
MGRVFAIDLDGSMYICKHCKTHLALLEDIVSKSFHCRHGKAYLFNKVVNVSVGEQEDRMMMTGMHTVVDIFCVGCGSIVGWKYEAAHEESQEYKVGKYILERFKVKGPNGSNYSITQDSPSMVGSDSQTVGSDTDDM